MARQAWSGAFHQAPDARERRWQVLDWVLRVLLALVFVAAGGTKLAGIPGMVAAFEAIGMGQWLRLLTGALEMAGGLLVLLPRLSLLGASLLACVILGAVATNVFLIDGSVVPPLVLLGLCALVVAMPRRGSPARLI